MVISIRAELPEDFVLTVRNDSGGDMLFRTSVDVEDLKEWNLGNKKEIQIDIDSETGIILGWKPITVKQVNKKIDAQRRERIEPRTSDTQNMFWWGRSGRYEWHHPSPPVNVDEVYEANSIYNTASEYETRVAAGTSNDPIPCPPERRGLIGTVSAPIISEECVLTISDINRITERFMERMASDEERT